MAGNNFNRFIGRVAVIAGGTYGIGYSVAERLAREGAKVVICSRKKENVMEAEKKLTDQGYQAKGVVCHVTNRGQRKELLDAAHKMGGLDILYVNAGVNPSWEGILDCPEAVWDKVFDVNAKAAYLLSQESLPMLKNSSCGRIIYLSTIGCFVYLENLGAYTVSKSTLLSLTKMASLQLGRHNITVNCIVAGCIDTRFVDVLFADKERAEHTMSSITLKRVGKPDEVASLVAFLASDEASYITGENIPITGGMNTRM